MDDSTRIETFKQWLRVRYRAGSTSPDIVGLRRYIDALGTGEASDSVAITQLSFEGGQANGQLVLEPMAKLNAALAVLAEIDPANTPPERPDYAYARFNWSAPCPPSTGV